MTEERDRRFYILDRFAAGEFAGREGVSMGSSTRMDDMGYYVRLDYLDWTYLPASATNRALSDIRAQHPKAPLRRLAALPCDATRQLLHAMGEHGAPRVP